tara:strand:+ start:342 stop:734 length:393 start_codon:yes stop_codon:yes gene_type:complete
MVANNPQSFFNGYLSAMRNSIITSSLGIAIYGFSRSFKKKASKKIMKRLSILVYIFSFIIMLNTVLLLRKYLNDLSKKEIKEFPKYIDLKKWRNYEYLGWFFIIIVLLIIILGSMDDIRFLLHYIIKSKK